MLPIERPLAAICSNDETRTGSSAESPSSGFIPIASLAPSSIPSW